MHKEIDNAIKVESEELGGFSDGQGTIILKASKNFASFALDNYTNDLLKKALELSAALAEYHYELYPPEKDRDGNEA